jgi:hypothetical protein
MTPKSHPPVNLCPTKEPSTANCLISNNKINHPLTMTRRQKPIFVNFQNPKGTNQRRIADLSMFVLYSHKMWWRMGVRSTTLAGCGWGFGWM